jgi:acetyltransferase
MTAYPKEWEWHLHLLDGRAVFIRPIKPEDEPLYGRFFAAETPEDLRRRFFGSVKEFSHAFIALDETTEEMLGVARLHDKPDNACSEYAIIVRSDLKSHGLGWQLMQMIIAYARAKAVRCIEGQVLRDNTPMLDMCRELGFEIKANRDEPYICDVRLTLYGMDSLARSCSRGDEN